MKFPVIAAILLVLAVTSPAKAKSPSCIPECPFFRAWALTKICPNLSLNEVGRLMVKTFDHGAGSESREILRGEMWGGKRRIVFDGVDYQIAPDPNHSNCNQCQSYDEKRNEETSELSPCRYLQVAVGRPSKDRKHHYVPH